MVGLALIDAGAVHHGNGRRAASRDWRVQPHALDIGRRDDRVIEVLRSISPELPRRPDWFAWQRTSNDGIAWRCGFMMFSCVVIGEITGRKPNYKGEKDCWQLWRIETRQGNHHGTLVRDRAQGRVECEQGTNTQQHAA